MFSVKWTRFRAHLHPQEFRASSILQLILQATLAKPEDARISGRGTTFLDLWSPPEPGPPPLLLDWPGLARNLPGICPKLGRNPTGIRPDHEPMPGMVQSDSAKIWPKFGRNPGKYLPESLWFSLSPPRLPPRSPFGPIRANLPGLGPIASSS